MQIWVNHLGFQNIVLRVVIQMVDVTVKTMAYLLPRAAQQGFSVLGRDVFMTSGEMLTQPRYKF